MEQTRRARLVRALAALPDQERRGVVEEAEASAGAPTTADVAAAAEVPAPILPWATLRTAIGLAHGAAANALDDCDRLYDG